MTESEWWQCQQPRKMLQFLLAGGQLSGRKARLFAVAACRRIWHLLPDDRSRTAVEVAEQYADGEATRKELAAAQKAIWGINCVYGTSDRQAASAAARYAAGKQRYYSTSNAASAASSAVRLTCQGNLAAQMEVLQAEAASQAELCRDIFGPLPFRDVAVSAAVLAWNDGCVVKMASSLYQERDFVPPRLGVLADALEEAGVADEEMLGHLRGPGPHCRGCWCVDLLLGKK